MPDPGALLVPIVAPAPQEAPPEAASTPAAAPPDAGRTDALSLLPAAAPKPAFGTKDSWRFNLEGDWMDDFEGANEVQARVGAAWFFVDGAELAMYGTGGYVWQPVEDAGTYGFDLEVRWHALSFERWSAFLSIGGSVMGSTAAVPSGGSSFNFTPNVGAGITLDVMQDTRLYLSARWYHISNAGLYADNPGRDSLSLWAGLSFAM
jgi:hypothetical protein